MGIELTGEYRWPTGLTLETTGTLQRSEDHDTGHDLAYTPTFKLQSTLGYILPRLKTRMEGTLRYEGVRYGQSENLPSQRLDDYVVVDLKATQPFSLVGKAADIYLKIDNLFDAAREIHLGSRRRVPHRRRASDALLGYEPLGHRENQLRDAENTNLP